MAYLLVNPNLVFIINFLFKLQLYSFWDRLAI